MEEHKPSFHRRAICCTIQELLWAQQTLTQLAATIGERMVKEIDREQDTMEEETAIILQMKTIPNIVCWHTENVATGAEAAQTW